MASTQTTLQAKLDRLKDATAKLAQNVPNDPNSAFIFAALKGELNTINELLKDVNTNVNAKDEESMTALHWAAAYNEPRVVDALLNDKRVDPNVPNKRQNTPLHQAAMYGSALSAERLLKDSRVKIDACNEWGETPLFLAANGANKEVCDLNPLKNPGTLRILNCSIGHVVSSQRWCRLQDKR
mmetsp:Transcript_20668/g.22962  ORF Transcript_20668/g.22962 Transcript_20668/m.22962 type:complete len:183 (+) Transcript_20668:823-1371(+)